MQNALASAWIELVDAATDVVQEAVRFRQPPIVSLLSNDEIVLQTEDGEPIENRAEQLAGAACRLGVPSHWLFRTELNPVPAESLPFLEAFARQQIERATPWRDSDVYANVTHKVSPDDENRVVPILTVLPKSLVASQISTLQAHHCATISICSDVKGEACEMTVGLSSEEPFLLKKRVSNVLALVFLLLPAIAGLCWWQASRAQDKAGDLSRQLTKVRTALVEANLRSSQAGAGSGIARPPVVLLLEDLSAVLPDTAYLTRLSIDGDRADISGIAANPTELVPVLEKSGQFSDVSFSDAITRSDTGAGNRFSLEMRVGSEKGRTR